MNRKIAFRAWDVENNKMIQSYVHVSKYGQFYTAWTSTDSEREYIPMQYTGLKDKKNLQEVYEGDIIDTNGNIKGNIYEMDKEKTDFVIQGFGTKTWCETYSRAILLGLKDAK